MHISTLSQYCDEVLERGKKALKRNKNVVNIQFRENAVFRRHSAPGTGFVVHLLKLLA